MAPKKDKFQQETEILLLEVVEPKPNKSLYKIFWSKIYSIKQKQKAYKILQ